MADSARPYASEIEWNRQSGEHEQCGTYSSLCQGLEALVDAAAFQGLTSRSTHRVAAQLSYGRGDAADESHQQGIENRGQRQRNDRTWGREICLLRR